MTKLSTVALSSSNSGRQIALVALRRLPIQPIPEYSAISRPTIPTPRGLATTLSINPVIGAASSAGRTSATWFSSWSSNSGLLPSTMPPMANPTIKIGTRDRNEK